jgi:transcriptional regulator with XRE-family HTH domain
MGYSQEALAAKLGVERTTVARWEQGRARPHPWTRPRLAAALGVSLDQLAGLLDVPAHLWQLPGTTTTDDQAAGIAACLPALRQALDAYDLPDDGPIRPMGQLRDVVTAVVGNRLESNYGVLVRELPSLLAELGRARLIHTGFLRKEVARLLIQAYRAADAVADKYGYYDLSARIIDRMRQTAEETSDPLLVAMVAYVRTEVFFANGRLETGRKLLERAANTIQLDSSTSAAATYGSLHMRAAVTAARAHQPGQARDHLNEAEHAASRAPERIYFGTAFGQSSVRIHRVSLAVELGDAGTALAAAAGWIPSLTIPAERRSHFYIDVARAHLQAGHPDDARAALFTARTIAPEHTTSHPQVQEMLARLG